MIGPSPEDNPIDEDACEWLYRRAEDGEGACAHSVVRVTWKQIRIEATAEDGSTLGPSVDPEGHVELSRRELERRGSVLHGPTRTRFYRSREEASGAA